MKCVIGDSERCNWIIKLTPETMEDAILLAVIQQRHLKTGHTIFHVARGWHKKASEAIHPPEMSVSIIVRMPATRG